jgi:hypothetical protein
MNGSNPEADVVGLDLRIWPRRQYEVLNFYHQRDVMLTMCRAGGTGRRAGLKIRWPQGRVGSIPMPGTNPFNCIQCIQ